MRENLGQRASEKRRDGEISGLMLRPDRIKTFTWSALRHAIGYGIIATCQQSIKNRLPPGPVPAKSTSLRFLIGPMMQLAQRKSAAAMDRTRRATATGKKRVVALTFNPALHRNAAIHE